MCWLIFRPDRREGAMRRPPSRRGPKRLRAALPRRGENLTHLARRRARDNLMGKAGRKGDLMPETKNPAAVALGALGGAVSGAKNMRKLNDARTRAERRRAARKAALARHHRRRG